MQKNLTKRANDGYHQRSLQNQEQLSEMNRSYYQKPHVSICSERKAHCRSNADQIFRRIMKSMEILFARGERTTMQAMQILFAREERSATKAMQILFARRERSTMQATQNLFARGRKSTMQAM
jgi:hypothetical protein